MSNKSLAKNSIYNVIYCGFTALFPLVSLSYISRILMVDGIGKIEYARTVVTYFIIISTLGVPNYGLKTIAQTGDDLIKKSRAFWEIFYLKCFSTSVCSFAYYGFITMNSYFDGRRTLFYIMGSLLIFDVANIDWYFQGNDDYSYITKRSIAIKILSFIFIVIFVRNTDDYIKYALLNCFAFVGNYVFDMLRIRKQVKFIPLNECDISKHVKAVLVLFGATLATEIYTMLDSVLLEYFHGEVYVGYYTNSVKIVRFIYNLSIAMTAAFYPRISLYIKDNNMKAANDLLSKGCKILIIFALPAAIGLFSVADLIIPILLGDTFIPSIQCARVLSVLVIIFSFAASLGQTVLIASGNENRILLATTCGAAVNFALNLLLIPQYKHNGAALASVIAEILVTVVMLTKSLQLIKIDISKRFINAVLLSSFFMFIVVKIIKSFALSAFLSLILCILTGATTFFIFLFFLCQGKNFYLI